jgi:hypothetical protein
MSKSDISESSPEDNEEVISKSLADLYQSEFSKINHHCTVSHLITNVVLQIPL